MAGSQPSPDLTFERRLMVDILSPELADDPRAFIRYAYPWGKANTPLAEKKGPHNWQDKCLKEMADYIRDARIHKQIHGEVPEMFRKAIASGRGIGKSACFSWLAHWLVSTRLGASVWVAANGEPQLKTKTFPEIAKWVNLGVNSHWFDVNATSIMPAKWFAELVSKDLKIDPKYWYIQAQLWSEENPDAFAGAHNGYGEMYLFDEASGIPKPIWVVAQGVFTEQIIDRYWLAFSNFRRNDGAFFECHNKNRESWRPESINALEVEGISHDAHLAIIKEHGEDSDEARVEVFGLSPNQATNQFIGFKVVDEAMAREVAFDPGAPLVMAADIARGERDYNVIGFRCGRDARSIPWQRFRSNNGVVIANRIAEAAQTHKVDAIFIDGNGVGGPVADMLTAWGYKVIEVQFGESPDDEDTYGNKRSECWDRMRLWLPLGAILDDKILRADLVGPHKAYHKITNKMLLESKDDMLKRGLASPDMADTLAMTFAAPIARHDLKVGRRGGGQGRVRKGLNTNYVMFR